MIIKAFSAPVGHDSCDNTFLRITYRNLRKANTRAVTRITMIAMIDMGRRHERSN